MYKEKLCFICNTQFIPKSPNQKFCELCKNAGNKIASRKRDLIRNRLRNNYVEYERVCVGCGVKVMIEYGIVDIKLMSWSFKFDKLF